MTLGYIAYLERNGRTFRLDNDNFEIDADVFTPPATQEAPLLAMGTSANRYGGSEKVGETAGDVELFLPVVVSGRSEASVRLNGQRLSAFLKSGGQNNPVYFCWKGNADTPHAPLWGQYGAPTRYEIIHAGTPQVDDFYHLGDTRQWCAGYNATLRVKPYAAGWPQLLASATGGILEDKIGTVDGFRRGLSIPEATENLFTNPIFGHSTWNNDYTAASNITASENKDPRFIVFGDSSARLTAVGGAAGARLFRQSIYLAGVGDDYTMSIYVMLPDGGEVTATECTMCWNGNEVTPDAYIPCGDGIYRLIYSDTSADTLYVVGLCVQDGYTVYADGFQVEAGLYATPLCHGNMLGCSWSGTAHASSTLRATARLRLPESRISDAQGVIRVVWKAPTDNTNLAAAPDLWYLFDGDSGLAAYFVTVSAVYEWWFTDGSNTASTSATPYSTNDVIVFHFVYGPSGMFIYINGALAASTPNYTPVTLGNYLYIGSSNTPDDHINGTFLDFATYDVAMTATEVLADYTNISRHVMGGDGFGQALSPIPWLWTKDGDNIVDNCNDSSRDNFAIIGGVPGSVPADTLFTGVFSSDITNMGSVWLSCFALDTFYPPGSLLYFDLSGTADGGASGGQFKVITSVGTGTTTESLGSVSLANGAAELFGRACAAIVRTVTAGTNLLVGLRYTIGGADGTQFNTEMRPVRDISSFAERITNPLIIARKKSLMAGDFVTPGDIAFTLLLSRSSGSANVTVDYVMLFPRPYVRIYDPSLLLTGVDGYALRGQTAVGIEAGGDPGDLAVLTSAHVPRSGDVLELHPGRVNYLVSVMGDDNGGSPGITTTLTHSIVVTPRWGIH